MALVQWCCGYVLFLCWKQGTVLLPLWLVISAPSRSEPYRAGARGFRGFRGFTFLPLLPSSVVHLLDR